MGLYQVEPKLMNGLALAYMGDGVYEQFVRHHLMKKSNIKPNHLHREATKYVSAKAQAKILFLLMDEQFFTEAEVAIIKRGRNGKSGTIPKNTDVITYRNATSFEAIIGFLYLDGQEERLHQLMQRSIELVEGQEK